MRIQQGAVPGRGEVSERKDRFHLRVGVDFKGEIIAAAGVEGADAETGKDGEKGVYFKRVSVSKRETGGRNSREGDWRAVRLSPDLTADLTTACT